MSISQIAAMCDARLNAMAVTAAESTADGFVVDSRQAAMGKVFVAIPGDRVDGHSFAREAVGAGAVAVLANRDIDDVPCIVVPDTVAALGSVAREYRRRELRATVVGITGSSGKTTTKDLVADLLDGVVVAARGSFNTEVGLPLTMLEADDRTDYLILEMGMRGLGHIAYLAELAAPDIGVVLNVGSAHLGMMAEPGDIAVAKGELVEGLSSEGYAVLNADDPQVARMAERTSAHVLWFGSSESADIESRNISIDSLGRPSFDLVIGTNEPVRVTMQLHGEHFVEAALAAAAVGHLAGMDPQRIADRLSSARARSRWRMEVVTTDDDVTVISDAYNANPESMRAALRALRSMGAGGRTWAVLGEMRELGDASLLEHDAIGRLAVRLDISRLVCVGQATKVMHLAASNEGSWGEESTWVPDAEAAIDLLEENLQPGDVVLVKASRSVGLEVVADRLLQRRRRSA